MSKNAKILDLVLCELDGLIACAKYFGQDSAPLERLRETCITAFSRGSAIDYSEVHREIAVIGIPLFTE